MSELNFTLRKYSYSNTVLFVNRNIRCFKRSLNLLVVQY